MMLEDEIQNATLFDDLHYEDAKIIAEAQSLLKSAPINGFIGGDGSDKVWFDKNISTQERILSLKARVDYLTSQYQMKLYKKEGTALSFGEYDDFKSKDEKMARLYANEPDVADVRLTLEKIKVISGYLSGLLWNLRDLMRTFK